MYSTHFEIKSVIAEIFIRTLKNKIYKTMILILINQIIQLINITIHIIAKSKQKPVHVKSNTYIDSSKATNNKDPKFKIGDIDRISKYKNIFAKRYTSKSLKYLPWTCY